MNSWSKTSWAAKFLIFIKLSDERNINIEWYYRLNVCAPPQKNSYVETKSPICRYLEAGLWEVIRSWGRSSHEWDEGPYKGDPRDLAALPCEDTVRRRLSMNLHQKTKLPAPYSWASQPTELWEVNFHVYKLLGLWYSVTEARTY